MERPWMVEERHSGWMMFAGFRVLLRSRTIKPSRTGAENDELVVVGGLTVSELEKEEMTECEVEEESPFEVHENDGTTERIQF
jgi:hypothetical protein